MLTALSSLELGGEAAAAAAAAAVAAGGGHVPVTTPHQRHEGARRLLEVATKLNQSLATKMTWLTAAAALERAVFSATTIAPSDPTPQEARCVRVERGSAPLR